MKTVLPPMVGALPQLNSSSLYRTNSINDISILTNSGYIKNLTTKNLSNPSFLSTTGRSLNLSCYTKVLNGDCAGNDTKESTHLCIVSLKSNLLLYKRSKFDKPFFFHIKRIIPPTLILHTK